jgi:hypothetical protein
MAHGQLKPVSRLGRVFVFRDHQQQAALVDVVTDLLHQTEPRPLPLELHLHKHQYRVGSYLDHDVLRSQRAGRGDNPAPPRPRESPTRTGLSMGGVVPAHFVS